MKHEEQGGPAFPFDPSSTLCQGMTLRQFYASQALHGMLAGDHLSIPSAAEVAAGKSWHDCMAEQAFAMADAMLRAGTTPAKD